jgi:peroxin-19
LPSSSCYAAHPEADSSIAFAQFPPYLAAPPAPLAPEDRTRYEAQLARVRDILAVFDAPDYSDSDSKAREKVVALMSEVRFLFLFLSSAVRFPPSRPRSSPSTRLRSLPSTPLTPRFQMQSCGSPPSELMGPLPPGLGALGEEGCVVC